jgi:hypothetical protein
MVGHKTITEHNDVGRKRMILLVARKRSPMQKVQKLKVILVTLKNVLTIHPAHHNMVNAGITSQSCFSTHGNLQTINFNSSKYSNFSERSQKEPKGTVLFGPNFKKGAK